MRRPEPRTARVPVASGPADFGWFAHAPLNSLERSPGIGADMWIMGLALSGFGTILGAVNFITTIIGMRHSAPDAPRDDVSRLGPEPGRGGPAAS
ncbi:cbb3-type cytochrome c oxidase subunit I [Streptomyces sp. MS2.AVA.5]|uniref:Cbb3-type cytochrome c oxidase subunit I n=1 Tax=Streptomyces achmelvichensis TaxID=3134111 RepID=A0ACC6PRJ2_9ACTN